MPIIAINGGFGSGKTLFLTLLGYREHQKKVKIYSNYKLEFEHELIDLDFVMALTRDNTEITNCVMLIDEVYTWLESRGSGQDEVNKALSYFIMQSRKRKVLFIYTSQLGSMVDLRFRHLADYYIVCDCQTYLGKPVVFEYTLIKKGKIPKTVYLPVKKAERFWNLYDTSEIIDVSQKENYKSGKTISDIQLVYNELKSKSIYQKMNQQESIEMMRNTYRDLNIKEGSLRLIYKMLHDKNFAKSIIANLENK